MSFLLELQFLRFCVFINTTTLDTTVRAIFYTSGQKATIELTYNQEEYPYFLEYNSK